MGAFSFHFERTELLKQLDIFSAATVGEMAACPFAAGYVELLKVQSDGCSFEKSAGLRARV